MSMRLGNGCGSPQPFSCQHFLQDLAANGLVGECSVMPPPAIGLHLAGGLTDIGIAKGKNQLALLDVPPYDRLIMKWFSVHAGLTFSVRTKLVFPELLEKTALVDFLKQREINKTLRRCLLCLRLPFSHFVQNKLYALESRVRNFLESL